MRRLVSLAFVALFFGGFSLFAEDGPPATPLDAEGLFAVFKVVPAGTAGGRAIPPLQRFPKLPENLWAAPRPVLTLRDVEEIQFPRQQVDDPTKPPRSRVVTGRLKYSEWGARRRAKAEGESRGGKLAEFQDGATSAVREVFGWSIGRTGQISFRGYLPDLANFDRRAQEALKMIREQPIQVIRTAGEQRLAPGWTLQGEAEKDELRLQVAGPPLPNGKPWTADARLAVDEGAPWMVCWETKCCVLWAASARELVSIHFEPSGEAIVARGEREEALRFADAPASVRRQIEKTFPPRDGDPAKRLGSIEGQLVLAGKPAPAVSIVVYTHFDADPHDGQTFTVKTDEAGHFRIPEVRAPSNIQISFEVMKWRHPNTGQLAETSGPAFCYHAHLVKDQVLKFDLGGEGQPVMGQLVDPANPQRDWSKSQMEFVLVPPCSETVAALRVGNIAYFADAYEDFLKTEAGRAYAPEKVTPRADGIFRLERVPSARYWIYVSPDGGATKVRVQALQMELLSGGKSDAALDLGKLKLLDHDAAPF